MNRIAQMPEPERAELFAETAERKGLPEAIIEKDFWVCWVLKQLFSAEELSGRVLFKGGTSLSKIFHAINRFSEDIDLAVDYAALGFIGEMDPRREEISKTKRVPSPAGGRQLRAFIVFNGADNAVLAGRGAIDMDGYPRLWHDFQPDTSDGRARDAEGKVLDPHGNGIRGYVINNSRNISFQDLLLLRSAYWTVNVFGSENFSTHHIKIVNRKQQYHDDAYDFSGSSHISIEEIGRASCRERV